MYSQDEAVEAVPTVNVLGVVRLSSAFIVDDVPTTTVGIVARVPNAGIAW